MNLKRGIKVIAVTFEQHYFNFGNVRRLQDDATYDITINVVSIVIKLYMGHSIWANKKENDCNNFLRVILSCVLILVHKKRLNCVDLSKLLLK